MPRRHELSDVDLMKLLERELPWLRAGDRPFKEGGHLLEDAHIADDETERRYRLPEGYRMAAEFLIDHALNERFHRDMLIYPIVFSYRHYLELTLKTIISTYGSHVGVEPAREVHRLTDLFAAFEQIMGTFGATDPAMDILRDCVSDFATIDPNSTSFRYPTHAGGKPVATPWDRIDLQNLRSVMKRVDGFFMGADAFLDASVAAKWG
jgi:hypothetical protein